MADETLGDTTPTHDHPLHQPHTTISDHPNLESIPDMDIDELIESARRPRTFAVICMRGDLQAEHDSLVHDLAQLVDAEGRLLVDDEDSLAESNTAQARAIAARIHDVKAQMRTSLRKVTFEGMSSDDWAVFYQAHYPKKEGADLREFNSKLISAASIAPALSEDQVGKLRGKLGAAQMRTLANKAWEACTKGGLDVPKSPGFLVSLAQKESVS